MQRSPTRNPPTLNQNKNAPTASCGRRSFFFSSISQKTIYKVQKAVYNNKVTYAHYLRVRYSVFPPYKEIIMKKQHLFARAFDGVRRAQKGVANAIYQTEREFGEVIQAVRERDPAARSKTEILLLYSGVHAIMAHRLAHYLHQNEHYFAARAVSQTARHLTGIEIHPGATIGRNFFIDHGSGVVIGETTEIGDNCTVYQGVTLGGTGKDVGKRHPTLGDNVMVGSGAKVLGPIKIGSGSKIAANAVVLNAVPENSTAVGIPARIVRRDGVRVSNDLDQVHIPDPVAQQLCRMEATIEALKKEIEVIKAQADEHETNETK